MTKDEQEIKWFESLLASIETSDLESAADVVRAAIGLKGENYERN